MDNKQRLQLFVTLCVRHGGSKVHALKFRAPAARLLTIASAVASMLGLIWRLKYF